MIPEAYAPYLRIGTCSWKYDSWKGLYYRKGRRYRADDYLRDYAEHLDSVEIDQWFWSLFPGAVKLPDPGTVKVYADSVPDDFTFTVKAPNALTLTHFYAKQPKAYAAHAGKPNSHFLDPDLLRRFLDLLAPLAGKLGPVMFQFEYLNRNKMAGKEAFLEALDRFFEKAPKGFQYAVETRNPNYLSREYFDFLGRKGLGHVYLEGYYMPHIGEVFDRFQPEPAAYSVIRLHGGDRLEIEQETGAVWNRVVAPKPEGLAAAVRIVRSHLRRRAVTFVNVNNHYEGSAPVTIERFLDALRLAD